MNFIDRTNQILNMNQIFKAFFFKFKMFDSYLEKKTQIYLKLLYMKNQIYKIKNTEAQSRKNKKEFDEQM